MSSGRISLLVVGTVALRWGLLAGQEPVPSAGEGELPFAWPDLPSWTPEELEMIREGELSLGTALFEETIEGVDSAELFEPLPEPEVEFEFPAGTDYPVEIGEEFLSAYFAGRPASYLVDPQGMLSMQEQKDRQAFLDYHAGDSRIDLYIYLFDKKQHVPPEGEMETIFKRHFLRGNGLSALVYYYLEDPGRSTLVMSPQVYTVINPNAVKGALIYAKQQAQLKSDPASQLENFSTGLSIRLYGMEQKLAEMSGADLLAEASGELTVVDAEEKGPEEALTREVQVMAGVTAASVLVVLGALVAGYRANQRKKVYLFPEIEVEPQLAAPYGAGVGAVIQFRDATLPPSLQKDDQEPDYLRKLASRARETR
ncbi:hypothetical protein [Roseibacillus ishigakijimensis]|uniref:Uncharacterized protein n=1 Tax=Roseibacillus ishigakijimensis TaxID=454146 RepID=A0A934VLR7_9BACT|nr:hypothetical protein [Roseibacillus ishigakijimensis]MBK1834964.1 hypothetical protein [Roseibacillus ishigakijimensis]